MILLVYFKFSALSRCFAILNFVIKKIERFYGHDDTLNAIVTPLKLFETFVDIYRYPPPPYLFHWRRNNIFRS